MSRTILILAALVASTACLASEENTSLSSEHAAVMEEACGSSPQSRCIEELRKVCHSQFTFRCYYSRKARLDAIRHTGFQEEVVHILDE